MANASPLISAMKTITNINRKHFFFGMAMLSSLLYRNVITDHCTRLLSYRELFKPVRRRMIAEIDLYHMHLKVTMML